MLVKIVSKASSRSAKIGNISDAGGQHRIEVSGSAETVEVLFSGVLFNKTALLDSCASEFTSASGKNPADIVVALYRKFGVDGFKKLNGGFVFVLSDSDTGRVIVVRDQIGIESLYYYQDSEALYVSDNLIEMVDLAKVPGSQNLTALYRYLLFNYVPGEETIYQNVYKLRPGFLLDASQETLKTSPWWKLSFKEELDMPQKEIEEKLLESMTEAVRLRYDSEASSLGMFLSGGMDSSSVLGLLRPMTDLPIHSFSFRCKGKSFDESHYAQIMSEAYSTEHHLVEYGADHVSLIEKMVDLMDEPFCDIGIEVASFLLAREIGESTKTILTGDGGDELFAGHPVYLADKTASQFDRLPGFVKSPITGLCSLLPDPEAKKNIWVKAKRFAYSVQFPKELYSNRWRLYYTPEEIRKLTSSDLGASLSALKPLDAIMALYDEADGSDFLSKTLYGDYHTVVNFYLRRMQLLRSFGVEGRFPLLDKDLVELAAKIPANLKIKDGKDTKYIQHTTMAGILPDSIVYRSDKLGHSVPFKNWMRESQPVKSLIRDVLSESTIKKRGLFSHSTIQTLIKQHERKTHNHSHRLWALVVLELWMQKHQPTQG